jgi:hypothetical protein
MHRGLRLKDILTSEQTEQTELCRYTVYENISHYQGFAAGPPDSNLSTTSVLQPFMSVTV